MSFYRNFVSKEELIAEYLSDQVKLYWAWWDAAIAPYAGDARRQLEALFDAYVKNNRDDCASGWALCNDALELREKRHPGFAITRDFKAEMRRRLCALAGEAGAAKANELGDGLLLVMEGGNFTRTAFSGSEGPYMVASSLAGMLLDAHCSIHRRCA